MSEFHREKENDQEVQAQALLAHSLLLERNPAAALKTVYSISARIAKIEDISGRIAATITVGTVRAQLGDHASAKSLLESAQAEASKCGYRLHQLEAALVLAGFDDNRSSRGSRLQAIELEAKAAGLGLIARKAAIYLQQ